MRLLELEDPGWVEFVRGRPEATLFHHPAWARLLVDCYGYRAMALALTDGAGAVTAGLPVVEVSRPLGQRRWVSLPFTDYCPPLAAQREPELVDELAALTRARAVRALELRAPVADHAGIQLRSAHVRHELALTGDVTVTWAGLFKNHRRNVRLAERGGVRIARGSSAADMETFYRLHLRTRRRLGVPIQPRRFFRLLLERVVAPGLGFVLTAYSGDTPIAAAIFGSWNGTLIYKYSARDERFAKLDANYLLIWTAIRIASENGCHTVDLGRSDLEQAPLRGFKNGWGALEKPLAYSWIANRPIKPSSRKFQQMMGKVIRNSAPWMCRTVGELFYRYAG